MVGSKKTLVSIIVVTFNSQKYISSCLGAALKTKYSPLEIIVVDNGSSDKTVEQVRKNFPKTKLIETGDNLGYAGGNNYGVRIAKGKLVAIINPDTQVSPGWLDPLVKSVSPPGVAVCQPKIMLSQNKNLINLTGKTTHYLGFDWPTDYQKKDYKISQKEITSFSGSAVLIKKDIFLKLGGFDDDFFMYYEDGDLSWRVRLMGYKILLVPDSVVYHEYKYQPKGENQKQKDKFYFLERNRLLMILKNYSWKTLILLLPAICFMEKGMNFYFFTKGWWFEKLKEYLWIIKNSPMLLKKRREIQGVRTVSDKEIVQNYADKIEFIEFDHFLLRNVGNPILSFYWRIVKRII